MSLASVHGAPSRNNSRVHPAMSENNLTKMRPAVQTRLRQEWLPVLRQVREQRRPMRLLLIAIVLIPLVCVVVLLNHMWERDLKSAEVVIAGGLMTVVATAFIYLGKIQACDDVLPRIECAILLGYMELLVEATADLGCYGQLKGVIEDARKILTKRD